MENSSTVRIDLQRLQILNDRLCQTLEALNQVRMSAHGLAAHQPTGVAFGGAYPQYPQYPQQQYWGAPIHPMFAGYPVAPGYSTALSTWGAQAYGQPFTGYPTSGVPGVGYSNGFDRSRAVAFGQPAVW